MNVICGGCGNAGPWARPTGRAIRCPGCIADAEQARNARRLHYRGDYRRRRKAALRRAGYRCEAPGCTTPTLGIECHHVRPADPASPLRILCSVHHVATFGQSATG